MSSAIRTICSSLRIQKPKVCEGIANVFQDDIDFILRNTNLEANEMCAVLLGLDCARTITPNLNWTLELPVKTVKPFNRAMFENKAVMQVVHLTDIHLDLHYMPGTLASCGEPLCCRVNNGFSNAVMNKAGLWGDYGKCDSPVITVIHALNHIKENHPFADYWLWTGDVGPHDVWNSSRSDVVTHIRVLTHLLQRHTTVPILPVIGNHEAVPANSFPPPELNDRHSISWLYDTFANEWSNMLPQRAVQSLR
ncbi:sphingomyelin phosphodiesterase-like protein 2 [Leptotrombidium deliense]|uniref:Sphingomyelin phosphodiesterase-like protein 2 n=1 Tax=Leptotrombidium deliense TaxID=299467 RepID=A0A443SA62_9ACAR|nr:sphingomyelin phosphodiesterase-like protein 2 [Leptotrombidium deliense]